jgi:hypothetical protein
MLSDSASLILSTKSTVNPVVFGPPVGGVTTKNSFTFNNIDLKNVMGEMWDKYDTFALKLVSCSTQGTTTTPSSTYSVVCWNVRGLEWVNLFNEYTGTHLNQQWAPIVFLGVQQSSPQTNPLITNTGQSFNFKKGMRNVNLEFAMSWVDTVSPNGYGGGPGQLGTTYLYNDVEFHFLFEPVIPGKMNECACFLFDTNPDPQIRVGRNISADRKEYSYPAFNMRNLCSLFWDKHTDFEIQMAQSLLRGTGSITGNNRIALVQMSGPNFVNNGTKQSIAPTRLNLSTENAIMGSLILGAAGSAHPVNNAYPVAPVQFKKDQDIMPLTITFKDNANTGNYAASFTGVHPCFQIAFFVKPIYGVEKGTLNLGVAGLSTTETDLGVVNASYTVATWKSIDMRRVCGSMWDKYDRFNIFLTQIFFGVGVANATNAAFMLQMEGFDFINQLSLTASNRQNQVATLGSFYATPVNTEPTTVGTMSSAITTFYKTKDFVDLTLSAVPLGLTAFVSQFPLAGNFTFTIVGVKM